ncbi:MAG: hypothetical protein GWN73_22355, partial [Actinobacteria bacterium]|nr:hypothetical protein [Actinomycetota bacterium]NIU68004.1 hypothetical protein [Actinomycetota bacterium]
LVALWQAGMPFPRDQALVEGLQAAHPELRGIVRVQARPGRRAVARQEVLWGEGEIDERVG